MEGLKLLPTADETGRLRIALVGEFDLAGVKHFHEVVTPALDGGRYQEIEFDLEQLTFVDSSGLHALVDTDRMMRATGRMVHVVGVAPRLRKVFELVGLDRVLTIGPRSPAARAAA
jgi:anti-sigma B factor antagonist